MSRPFYITTAIDYPNGSPHIGHAYEKVVTDFYARWYSMRGREVYFLTGTDENGQKISEAAQEAGEETQAYVDGHVAKFRQLCDDLNITHNDFIRTTEERHAKAAQAFWKTLEDKGDIHFGKYSGQYCLGCESFYTETQAPDGQCPNHHTPLQTKEEEGYFLKMSAYQDWILNHLRSHPDFVVPSRSYKEIVSRLENDELRDLAISRPSVGWGVPVPGNEKFVMYTWFDALINYRSALVGDQERYWPASVHVIGKDIAWFHCVIWPIMLHAAGYELPEQVYVHGMVLAADGKKMSKSLGNVIDPREMMEKYPVETFRYTLLRAISSVNDGPFSEEDLIHRHNSELANDFGNLVMRVVKLAAKRLGTTITMEGVTPELNYEDLVGRMEKHVDAREHHKALDVLWEGINQANQFINDKAPWKVKEDPAALKQILANAMYGIHQLSVLLWPVLPQAAEKTLKCLGVSEAKLCAFGQTYELSEPEMLFAKIELPE